VAKALEHVGAEAEVTADPTAVRRAEGIVLPGVGAFPKAMERIREARLDELVEERNQAGVPILGICLGLQLLFESSTELGGSPGLGLLEGEVTAIDAGGLKVPHIGWSPVEWEQVSPLQLGIDPGTPFYFVHSFAVRPREDEVLGTVAHGERFACAVQRDRVFGVQFHPEKSSGAGLALLANFAGFCARTPAPA
jgi:glutamine amidotransferase